jgi:hypothetical protein
VLLFKDIKGVCSLKNIFILLVGLNIAVCTSFAQQPATDFPKLTGPYLGQKPPGKEAKPFAPGIIAAQFDFHGSVVFSLDGTEAYWCVMDNGMKIMKTKRVNEIWTEPELLFPNADVPFITPDGNQFFFMEQKIENGLKNEVMCVMDKTPTGWSETRPLPDIINSIPNIHWQMSVDKNGNLYFGACGSGGKGSRIYCSEFVNGKYNTPKIINELKDVEAFSPYISHDGSYLIVTEVKGDLMLSIYFRKADGTWTKGKNISDNIEVSGEMLCPVVTLDSKYLFFLKGVGKRTIPYWVDASFIEDLRKTELGK